MLKTSHSTVDATELESIAPNRTTSSLLYILIGKCLFHHVSDFESRIVFTAFHYCYRPQVFAAHIYDTK